MMFAFASHVFYYDDRHLFLLLFALLLFFPFSVVTLRVFIIVLVILLAIVFANYSVCFYDLVWHRENWR